MCQIGASCIQITKTTGKAAIRAKLTICLIVTEIEIKINGNASNNDYST